MGAQIVLNQYNLRGAWIVQFIPARTGRGPSANTGRVTTVRAVRTGAELPLGSMPVLLDKANTNPAYEAVVTEALNTRPNNPCRSLNGRIRAAFDRQIKRFGRKYRFPTGARDQCSATTDILGFSGQDTLRALDRDRVPDIKSFASASFLIMCTALCQDTHLVHPDSNRGTRLSSTSPPRAVLTFSRRR